MASSDLYSPILALGFVELSFVFNRVTFMQTIAVLDGSRVAEEIFSSV